MPLKHSGHQGDASLCWHVRESHKPRMRRILYVHEFSEVSINRHQDSPVYSGAFEQGAIPWVLTKLAGLKDIVPLAA